MSYNYTIVNTLLNNNIKHDSEHDIIVNIANIKSHLQHYTYLQTKLRQDHCDIINKLHNKIKQYVNDVQIMHISSNVLKQYMIISAVNNKDCINGMRQQLITMLNEPVSINVNINELVERDRSALSKYIHNDVLLIDNDVYQLSMRYVSNKVIRTNIYKSFNKISSTTLQLFNDYIKLHNNIAVQYGYHNYIELTSSFYKSPLMIGDILHVLRTVCDIKYDLCDTCAVEYILHSLPSIIGLNENVAQYFNIRRSLKLILWLIEKIFNVKMQKINSTTNIKYEIYYNDKYLSQMAIYVYTLNGFEMYHSILNYEINIVINIPFENHDIEMMQGLFAYICMCFYELIHQSERILMNENKVILNKIFMLMILDHKILTKISKCSMSGQKIHTNMIMRYMNNKKLGKLNILKKNLISLVLDYNVHINGTDILTELSNITRDISGISGIMLEKAMLINMINNTGMLHNILQAHIIAYNVYYGSNVNSVLNLLLNNLNVTYIDIENIDSNLIDITNYMQYSIIKQDTDKSETDYFDTCTNIEDTQTLNRYDDIFVL
jgi:hypothetical protein